MIPKELIDEIKKIFKEEYGIEYTDLEAIEATNNLVGYFELLIRIDKQNKPLKTKRD